MSKLSELLNAKEPLFSKAIRDLEKITNSKSLDVSLITEIEQKAGDRMRRLGLDPQDTTGLELFKALENRIIKDNERVTKLIGGEDSTDVKTIPPLAVATVKKAKISRTCWALKRSVAKELLRKMPPKKMMSHLGYRSVDSMLKREIFDEIYTALRFSEGSDWLNQYNELFKSVRPSDFEEREISILVMDHDKWVDLTAEFVKKKRHNVTHSKELGTIVVVPMKVAHMPGLTLKTLPMLLHYINEVRLYSAFFKYKSTQANFGAEVVDTLIADPSKAAILAGQHIHWRVIQRYYGKLDKEKHPEQFEPHLQPEDLHWRKAEDMLFDIDPEMEFWRDLDYVMVSRSDGPVSLNLVDVSFAYSNQETYKNRYVYHAREALWNEIFMRYMGEKVLEEQILRQLDNDLVAPERLVSN